MMELVSGSTERERMHASVAHAARRVSLYIACIGMWVARWRAARRRATHCRAVLRAHIRRRRQSEGLSWGKSLLVIGLVTLSQG